jgi:hypothetical protein
VILRKGFLKTVSHSYRGNLEQLFSVTSSWPAQVAGNLAMDPGMAFGASVTEAPVFKVPGNGRMILFLFRLVLNKLSFHFRDLFAAEDWNIGIVRKPVHEVAFGPGSIEDSEISWLPSGPRKHYLADPSGYMADGRLHILAEDYNYAEQKAGIVGIDTGRAGQPARVIVSALHLSYPFIVEHPGEVYCIPESYQSGRVTLYRRNPSTGMFDPEKTLVDGVEAVDPSLVFHDGLWWLFFTEKRFSNTHLHLWYAPGITGEYRPHPGNPVKMDIRSARPAGTPFLHGGILYRPAQDCSVTYGGRVVINRVTHLSAERFTEEVAGTVGPVSGSRYDRGLHTISGVGDVTLIDGKRFRFNWRFFLGQLKKKFNR